MPAVESVEFPTNVAYHRLAFKKCNMRENKRQKRLTAIVFQLEALISTALKKSDAEKFVVAFYLHSDENQKTPMKWEAML